ncbi:MAG TPA: Ig-like domain-containing protein [Anaerolineaceae bacterium]|nr:Ig-like domain-containing protein [Anaerolineaceae bacterium]HQJ33479.1 Ig-like domain-containing protein [Anaerolineaceae bacterium]
MKNRIFMLFVLAMVFALSFSAVMAQESPFTLRMVRDWGYGNGTDINGRMSLSVKGDQAQIQQVTFFIDGEVMASVTSAPFKLQFDTNNFESGMHRLTAEVKTIAGETYTTNGLVSNFVEKGAANQSTLKILLLVGGIVAVSMGIQFLMQKNANKNPKYDKNGRIQYGVWGAAVCPSCGQPFNRSFLGINLVGVRLERCPHCGKLVAARRASPLEIERANQKTQPEEPQKFVEKPEEDDLDESRFVDL